MNNYYKKAFSLKNGYYENYFVKDKQGTYSLHDIECLFNANTDMYFDCVDFVNDKMVFNANKCYDIKTLNDFIDLYKKDIQDCFNIVFDTLSEKAKYNLLNTFFDIANAIQENCTFIESSYKKNKSKAIDELIDYSRCYDNANIVKNNIFSNNLFIQI